MGTVERGGSGDVGCVGRCVGGSCDVCEAGEGEGGVVSVSGIAVVDGGEGVHAFHFLI